MFDTQTLREGAMVQNNKVIVSFFLFLPPTAAIDVATAIVEIGSGSVYVVAALIATCFLFTQINLFRKPLNQPLPNNNDSDGGNDAPAVVGNLLPRGADGNLEGFGPGHPVVSLAQEALGSNVGPVVAGNMHSVVINSGITELASVTLAHPFLGRIRDFLSLALRSTPATPIIEEATTDLTDLQRVLGIKFMKEWSV